MTVGGIVINPRDVVVLDADGAAVVPVAEVANVVAAARQRTRREEQSRVAYRKGELQYDLAGWRAKVEGGGASERPSRPPRS